MVTVITETDVETGTPSSPLTSSNKFATVSLIAGSFEDTGTTLPFSSSPQIEENVIAIFCFVAI